MQHKWIRFFVQNGGANSVVEIITGLGYALMLEIYPQGRETRCYLVRQQGVFSTR